MLKHVIYENETKHNLLSRNHTVSYCRLRPRSVNFSQIEAASHSRPIITAKCLFDCCVPKVHSPSKVSHATTDKLWAITRGWWWYIDIQHKSNDVYNDGYDEYEFCFTLNLACLRHVHSLTSGFIQASCSTFLRWRSQRIMVVAVDI